MFIDFKKMRFRNILSYGNKWTELDFHKGLNLIKAQNGSGKSTILDAMNFVLFGKPFRDIKMNQLINKYNGKELEVEIEFTIGNDTYELTRGLKPTFFNIKKNNNIVNSLSSKRLNQEEINKLIGIDEKLFKNIVGISVFNNKPFLSMSTGDKRALIESIFNIDVLGLMQKEVKKRNSLNRTEQSLKIIELNGYNNSINDNRSYIKNTQSLIDRFDSEKLENIKKKEEEISNLNKKIETNLENISIGEKALNSITVSNDVNDDVIIDVNKKIAIQEHEKDNINKTLKTIGNNKFCPICNSILDEGHALEHINNLKNELSNIEQNIIPKLVEEKERLESEKRNNIKNNNKIEQIKQRVQEEKFNIVSHKRSIERIESDIEDLKNKKCEISLTEYEERIKELENRVAEISKNIDNLKHNIIYDELLMNILGDEGLRMFFFNRLIPVLNQRINYYLKKFEMAVEITFDSTMNEIIKTGKFEQQYNQFSGGEKSRIDMAILLSFFDISKIISNWSCSLLFVDEVLDSGVDSNGTEQFISTLYNIITENDKSLGIYIISHKLAEVQVDWNNIIQIEKKSLFSELKVK